MSGTDDGEKRQRGAGRSGSAGSIGKELGGDLDFEADALLDSLLSDEAPPAKNKSARPPAAALSEPPPPPPPRAATRRRRMGPSCTRPSRASSLMTSRPGLAMSTQPRMRSYRR